MFFPEVKDSVRDGRTVYITGEVSSIMISSRRQIRELVMFEPSKPIHIVIDSPGGSVLGGFSLMDEMERLRNEYGTQFIGTVVGQAMSMGLTILQACDVRKAGPYSVLMAHGSRGMAYGDRKEREAYERVIDIMHDKMAHLYAERSTVSVDEWLHWFNDDTPVYFSAEEALDKGLIDEIVRG